uniref:beta-glucosidase n=1 Tax=Cucumis melo TaxID=3656 RepID=A0A9I9DT21_CUCME
MKVMVVLLCCWAALVAVDEDYVMYKDPIQPLNIRIKDLMDRMTLADKVGQMAQLDSSAITPEIIRDYSIGSVLSSGGSTPSLKATAQEWIAMVNSFQQATLSSRLGIPIMYGIDAVHGHNGVYNATVFPHNLGWCNQVKIHERRMEPELLRRIGAATGKEVRGTGIDYVFAPCIARSKIGNGAKMHSNHELVVDFLKNSLNFRFIDGLTYLVVKNAIPMSRINDAVRRILRVEFMMDLFENPLADDRSVNELGSQEHKDLATEAVRKSLVLLKNVENADEPVLPLSKKAPKILVAGTHANNLGYQCSGRTITRQGLRGNNLTTGTTILEAVKKTVDPNTEVIYNVNPTTDYVKANNFSYAIFIVGETPSAESKGDNLNLTIAEGGSDTIQNVCN